MAFNAGLNTLDDLILVKNFAESTGVNVGTNIPTGVTKRLTWDIANDWGSDFGQLQMEILAKDSRDLLNLDFIQMPAVSSDPLLKISRTPLNDSDFLSVWYWLLANSDPGIKLTYGKVFPTNAATTFTYSGGERSTGVGGKLLSLHRLHWDAHGGDKSVYQHPELGLGVVAGHAYPLG